MKYLDWVHQQPCWGCGKYGVDAHHVRLQTGMGKKPADLHVIPVCRTCHQKCHALEYTKEEQLTWLYKTQDRAILAHLIKW